MEKEWLDNKKVQVITNYFEIPENKKIWNKFHNKVDGVYRIKQEGRLEGFVQFMKLVREED